MANEHLAILDRIRQVRAQVACLVGDTDCPFCDTLIPGDPAATEANDLWESLVLDLLDEKGVL